MNRAEINRISKEKILSAAIAEFGENGYSAARISSICQNHHISKGKLFYYYKNKEELFLVCVEKCINEICDWLNSEIRSFTGDFMMQLDQCYQAKFKFFALNPRYDKIFFDAAFNPPTNLRDEIDRLMEPFYAVYRVVMRRVLERVVFKPETDVDQLIDIVFVLSNNNHMKFKCYTTNSTLSVAEESQEQCKGFLAQVQMLLLGAAKEDDFLRPLER